MELLFIGSFSGSTILLTIGLAWVILNIILFFKLWRACDNIKRIADKYAPDLEKEREKRNRPHSSVETKEELEKWLNEGK